ncbi:RING finger protein 222 [Varanus komodoensis]|uniref:Ring finger protein 222 n=1 Tax=Varanus komodoensis TaxID=61221 RepID=A0A8D2IVP2_VARKO|nr:RING finger protein 222 [Varanus komodoensis]
MSQGKTSKEAPAVPSAECPVCYEPFQSPKVSRRTLSCGHTFCHDCLVKCLLASREEGRFQNSLICPVCRFVTFLCKKRACWSSKQALTPPSSLELPLSPSSLPCGVSPGPANTLMVPSHFLMPSHTFQRSHSVYGCPSRDSVVPPGGWEPESHIFMITQCGMPLIEENYVPGAQDSRVEAAGSVASQRSLGTGCFQSPIMLAIFLVSTVALLGAVLPWLLLVRQNE